MLSFSTVSQDHLRERKPYGSLFRDISFSLLHMETDWLGPALVFFAGRGVQGQAVPQFPKQTMTPAAGNILRLLIFPLKDRMPDKISAGAATGFFRRHIPFSFSVFPLLVHCFDLFFHFLFIVLS